jgi:hypothetical protein
VQLAGQSERDRLQVDPMISASWQAAFETERVEASEPSGQSPGPILAHRCLLTREAGSRIRRRSKSVKNGQIIASTLAARGRSWRTLPGLDPPNRRRVLDAIEAMREDRGDAESLRELEELSV